MIFNEIIGTSKDKENVAKVVYREAVRAIVIHKGKILTVQSNLGDYKLPGGGIEHGESHSEALFREVAEETGYLTSRIIEKIGVVVEKNIDRYGKDAIFQMTSHYYLCELTNETVSQQLDGYEVEQGFTLVWISILKAIQQNDQMIHQLDQNRWIQRGNLVFKKIKSNLL